MKKLVSVVVPIYKRMEDLYEFERISWQQCLRVFRHYDMQLVCPAGFDISDYTRDLAQRGIHGRVCRFSDSYFKSTHTYNKLLQSIDFFRTFRDYEYILITQLDVFLFVDKLQEWCRAGYSYVGAPWFKGFLPSSEEAELWTVGNGGLSLRRIEDCLRVLTTFSFILPWGATLQESFAEGWKKGLRTLPAVLRRLILGNNTHHYFNGYPLQEDIFWSVICARKFPWYTMPSPREALNFSFEVLPDVMYKMNNEQLPMGCHAWEKYNVEFWRPFVEKEGYALNNLR
ncbi:DUF5672 family protein [Hymenobacter persicinus]|uniref:DUF5672 domain-containing protein n=1 Tax=Hymenobacter persicinus TaxID=2025506 RepID=A0A4Q5LGD8_9BACT|nr:DUF5672 family protein [Hymenobacter persicinus]RYU82896.1 hypothetical protein EWM57_04185 [Hymenobacter persicinus]